jgi:NAD(P)-dependent dehydrogenase (short-subunit alcohol dehydrogenase family)
MSTRPVAGGGGRGRWLFRRTDVTSEDDVRDLFAAAHAAFGLGGHRVQQRRHLSAEDDSILTTELDAWRGSRKST